FIYRLPERPLRFRRMSEWIASRAEARPRKAKGTVRPQQGLEYICARLIEAGVVRPPRHLSLLHEGLIRAGAARYFGAELDPSAVRRLGQVDDVARRVRRLLGCGDHGATEATTQRPALAMPEPSVAEVLTLHPLHLDTARADHTAARRRRAARA